MLEVCVLASEMVSLIYKSADWLPPVLKQPEAQLLWE